jgi:hypothetical protein
MTTELATRTDSSLVKDAPVPAFGAAEMRRALTAYRALQAALDESLPDCLQHTPDGKTFRKKNYWRAVATAFNLTVDCLEEVREVYGLLEHGGENYGYRVTYRASTPGGRATVGDGSCTAQEKSRGRLKPSEHNCRSHAHTRAFNRAVSNLVAFGEVSFEELDDREEPPTAWADKPPAQTETLKQARQATSKYYKPTAAPLVEEPRLRMAQAEAPLPPQSVTVLGVDPPPKGSSKVKGYLRHSGSADPIAFLDDIVWRAATEAHAAGVPVVLEIAHVEGSGKPYVKGITEAPPF